MKYNLNVGDCLSETSYYKVTSKSGNKTFLVNLQNNKPVALDNNYIDSYCKTAETVTKEVIVTKEDTYYTANNVIEGKRVGDLRQLGIRSIWNNIGAEVFTICYNKLPKAKTKKVLQAELDAQIEKSLAIIEKAQVQKKGVLEAAKRELHNLQSQPISNTVTEERVLRGHKIQRTSLTGLYKVYDMVNEGERQINLPTVKWIIVDGVKYICK
jgi:hypothetical protein